MEDLLRIADRWENRDAESSNLLSTAIIYLFTSSHDLTSFGRRGATAFYLTSPITLLFQMCPHFLFLSLPTHFIPPLDLVIFTVRIFSIYHLDIVFISKLCFKDKPLLNGLVFPVLEISFLLFFLLSFVLFFA